jgi:MHS family proline/betaine transporter-like MFS transporter
MQTGDIAAVLLGQLGFAVLVGAYVAVNPIAICEIFPRAVRCSAVSTDNITVGVVGGTAPVVATWLIEQTAYPLWTRSQVSATIHRSRWQKVML